MRLFHNRKRSSLPRPGAETRLGVGLVPIVLLAFCSGHVKASLSCTVAKSYLTLGGILIYSAIPQISSKSIRQGIEIENDSTIPSTFSSTTLSPPASVFSSRSLQLDNATSSEEEHLDSSAEDSSKMANLKQFEKSKGPKRGRVSRQMGLAAEIAMVAPALQTMGCIPKFFCGMNSKSPTEGTTTLNDLAYLIKFAMLDDDDVEDDDGLFDSNDRGKDGLQGSKKGRNPLNKIKEDLIVENMAEEELIQEDPANLPFVWQDMEHRIKTKTKPGTKERLDDEIMDAIIVEPEQSHMTSLFTGLKSVLRIGRSVDHVLATNSSQGSARSGFSYQISEEDDKLREEKQLWGRRRWPLPFMKSPKFRQEMELAHRIGKEDKDDTRCSSTFNTCPYTVHEMMEIVYGGYKKRNKNKKKPQWFLNAEGPPESSEEIKEKPFKDPLNLITTTTTTTRRPSWRPSDPEQQILYAILPHKAIEKGITPTPPRRPRPQPSPQPVASIEDDEDDKPERPKQGRRPPIRIQQHVEYENDDEYSKEGNASQLDMKINKNKRRPWKKQNPGQFNQKPPSNGQGPTPFSSPAPASSEERNNRKKNDGSESQEDDGSSEENGGSNDQRPSSGGMPPGYPHGPMGHNQLQQGPMGHNQPQHGPMGHNQPQHGPMGHNQPQHGPMGHNQQQPQQSGGSKLQQLFSSITGTQQRPISQPRPKYTVQKQKQGMILPALPPMHTQPQQPMPFEENQKEKNSDEEEGEEESQENSSEEVKTKKGSIPIHMQTSSSNQNIIIIGRPSEEVKPGDMAFFQQQTNNPTFEDEPENSEEQNSNSGPVWSREQMMMEMEKIPKPAQPPGRMNNSNEYTYSDEMPPPQSRPINYSYFKRPHEHEQGNRPPGPSGSPDPPQTSTQKLSTGFLGFIFGNKDKQQGNQQGFGGPTGDRRHPPASGEDDAMDDDDDSDEDDEPQSEVVSKQHLPGAEGTYEVGQLGQQSAPVKPNFQPPVRPQRPFKGSTSMEDSDEKRFRSSAPPPTLPPQSPLFTDPSRPILFLGKPHRIQIPMPATPPAETPAPPSPPAPTSTKPPKDSEDDEDKDSDEKQSEESKESSEERGTKTKKKQTKKSQKEATPLSPPTNKHSTLPPKTRSEKPQKNKKRADDSKEDDDSGEDKSKEKDSAESDEGSSEEEKKKPARRPSPPPTRKPEDDELESPNNDNLPPLPPFGGDIAVIGDILGAPVKEHEDDDDGYGPDEDIPAPPPLIQGFAQSLEIVVPTKPPPLVPSNNVALQQAPAGTNQGAGGLNGGGATGTRDPSDQAQGVRNPSGSNRGPSNNGNRGQQRPKEDGDKKDKSSEENSSEEKKAKSSEEASSEETDVIKGAQGFEVVTLGGDKEDEENEENEDSPGKHPPHPPPVFTGTPSQKQQININKPFLPRPVSASQYRPTNLRLGMNQKPSGGGVQMQQRPSFVSNLLRPLMGRPAYKKKPLDPKVVQWIKDSYGIPDLEQPNRSGLESQAAKGKHSFLNSTTTSKPKTSKSKSSKNKSVEKSSKKRKSPDYVTEEKEHEMAQALFDSSEEIGLPVKTTSSPPTSPPPKKTSSERKTPSSTERKKGSGERQKSSEVNKKRKPTSSEKRKSTSKETKKISTSNRPKPLVPPKIVPAKLRSKVSRVKSRTPSIPKLPPIYGKKKRRT